MLIRLRWERELVDVKHTIYLLHTGGITKHGKHAHWQLLAPLEAIKHQNIGLKSLDGRAKNLDSLVQACIGKP